MGWLVLPQLGRAFELHPIISALRVILVAQTLFCALPVAIYCAIKLHLNWNEFFMTKRGPTLILFTFVAAAWLPLFEFPYYAIVSLHDPHITYYTSVHEWIAYPTMCSRLLEISFITLRVYLLWFDRNHSNLVSSEGWRVVMDPDIGTTNHFLKNKTSLGNSRWMIRNRVFPLFTVWFALWMAVHFYLRYIKHASSGILSIAQLLFSVIWLLVHLIIGWSYWLRYSSFLDNHLGIRLELQRVLWMMALGVVAIGSVTTINVFLAMGYGNQWIDEFANVCLMILLSWTHMAMLWLLMVFPETKWRDHRDLPRKSTGTRNTNSWMDIVAEKEGFESFCNYLAEEFATENLLFMTEYAMIKRLVSFNQEMDELLAEKALSFELELPGELALSRIAREYEEKQVVITALHEIYLKYIVAGAPLEINVSSSVRKEIHSLFQPATGNMDISEVMDTETVVQVMVLMDASANQVALLLNSVFGRFRYTEVYRELERHCARKREKREGCSIPIPLMNNDSFRNRLESAGQFLSKKMSLPLGSRSPSPSVPEA